MDEKVKDYIKSFTESIPVLKWTKIEQLHITLKFLGDTSNELFPEVMETLKSVKWEKFKLSIQSTGFFPNRQRAEVFWLGINEETKLIDLKNEIDKSLLSLGILPEKREFAPHLTLLRLKYAESRTLPDKLEKTFAAFTPQTFKVNSFYLYSSKLDRSGAIHSKEAEYKASLN